MTSMILKVIGIIIIVILVGIIVLARLKGVSPLSWKMHKPICQTKKVAISGFDPVHYFKFENAKKGDDHFSYSWKDVDWHFTSQENLEKFKENPDRYEPQFGGWCSFAVSKGFTATSDPNAWSIHGGKLYLFADGKVKKNWEVQLPNILEKCRDKWTY